MALGLQTESGGGNFAEVLKYDARAGRMFRVDRTQGASGWETNNVEVTEGFHAIFDFESIEVGWILFAAGVAPVFAVVPYGMPMPDRPSDQFKQGFRLNLKLGKSAGGDVREFASTAKVVIGAVDTLHTAYEAGRAANPGKLPVVALVKTIPVVSTGKGQSSTNYAPVFEIKDWIDRPAELTKTAAAVAQPQQQPAQQPASEQKQPATAGAEF